MEESAKQNRTEEVRIKLQPDMKKRVERIAAMHGQPASTWVHSVMAKAVVEFERNMALQNKTVEEVASKLVSFMGPRLEELLREQLSQDVDGAKAEVAPETGDN